jgi:predicted  nucleic acid-binding Zn-ribbon protein
MKRMVLVSVISCSALVCSCQKQDTTAKARLAQQKTELDAREKALNEREKKLAEREKGMTRLRTVPSRIESPRPAVDPEQAKAERERRIQQLPPELQALIRDRTLLDARAAEKNRGTEDRAAELQRRLEEARSKKIGAMATPGAEISDTQTTSPSPSSTPE